jgi:hypothetical protein
MPKSMAQTEVRRLVYVNGIPEIQKVLAQDVTVHDLAEWFPTDPDSCGFLFLDELFRASKDLQNAVMELALDYRYHFRELPIGWRVVSASNDNMDVYAGNSPDPALYDRFLKIKFKPSLAEWMAFAENDAQVHASVLKYLGKFPRDLGLDREGKIEAGKIIQSPRSWISLSDCIKHMTENGDDVLRDHDYLTYLAKGYLGDTVAINYVDYIKKDYKIYSAQDILEKWNDVMEQEFKDMLVTEIAFYSTEIVTHIKKVGKNLSKKESENLIRWVKAIPKESASGFWSKFSADCRDIAAKWYKEAPGATDYIFGFLAKSKALAK